MIHDFLGSTWAFFVTSLISLFVIIDPPANVFPFLALSQGYPPAAAQSLARRACLYAFLILAVFTIIGRYILDFFGISLPAFQIAGGLILFRIAFDMLEGRGHFDRLDTSSSLVATEYRDVALVPLAMPLISGPGAITTVLVLASRAKNQWEILLILISAAMILVLTYLLFVFTEKLVGLLRENTFRLLTRIMGLILAALAAQFVLRGVKQAFPSLG
jgi:multiple antibiotic resistance protein